MQKVLMMRLGVIGFLIILLLIPLGFIQGIVAERKSLQQQVQHTIAASSAGSQSIIGPVLVVPYVWRELVITTNDKGKQSRQFVEHHKQAYFAPEQLDVDGRVEVESKYKGIYKALAYKNQGTWVAEFSVPANLGLDYPPIEIRQGAAYLAFGITDVRGLVRAPKANWDGVSLTFSGGTQFTPLGDGLHADIGVLETKKPRQYRLSLDLTLAGSDALAMAPIARTTTVNLRSDWPHPSFGGRFLPQTKTIDDSGFTARWEISHLASRNWKLLNDVAERNEPQPQIKQFEAFDVGFILPVNIYQQAERALKYGVLFIALTFATFFLFETLKALRIHPLQYGLVGVALAVFFLLLVSLSEHIYFLLAYIIASSACVMLIGYYLSYVLGSWRRGALMSAMLATLYTILYGLLLSEDNALLLGTILLFVVLAVFMSLTRNLDWYGLGDSSAKAESQSGD